MIALLIFFLSTTISVASNAQAKGWRGIVPLHSTRTDVEQLLGKPNEKLATYSVLYRTMNETIIVDYAQGRSCGRENAGNQWKVPRYTVERILVTLNRGVPLTQLGIDETKYKKRSGGDRPEDVYYVNEENGETLRVFQDEVLEMTYFPAAADEHLRCPAKRNRVRGRGQRVPRPLGKQLFDAPVTAD